MSSNKLEFEEFTARERLVLEALRGLRYGSLEVVVHDGRAVQIERREKVRLETPGQPDRRPPDDRRRK
jgi:hypothetical protein